MTHTQDTVDAMRFDVAVKDITLDYQMDGIPDMATIALTINGLAIYPCHVIVYADSTYRLRPAQTIKGDDLSMLKELGYPDTFWYEDVLPELEKHLGVQWSMQERRQVTRRISSLMLAVVTTALAHKQWRNEYKLQTEQQRAVASLMTQDWSTSVPTLEGREHVVLGRDGGHAVLLSANAVLGRLPITPEMAQRVVDVERKHMRTHTAYPEQAGYLADIIDAVTEGRCACDMSALQPANC